MSNKLTIIAADPTHFVVTLEQFEKALAHWGPQAQLLARSASDADPSDAAIQVERPDEKPFQIFHVRSGAFLYTDGNPNQAAEVAVWAVNSFPMAGPGELWLVDQAYSGHSVLRPGMSAAEVLPGWQQHT